MSASGGTDAEIRGFSQRRKQINCQIGSMQNALWYRLCVAGVAFKGKREHPGHESSLVPRFECVVLTLVLRNSRLKGYRNHTGLFIWPPLV